MILNIHESAFLFVFFYYFSVSTILLDILDQLPEVISNNSVTLGGLIYTINCSDTLFASSCKVR